VAEQRRTALILVAIVRICAASSTAVLHDLKDIGTFQALCIPFTWAALDKS
jgi:hypothetical protein